MNDKGQSLVFIVLLIPFLLIILSFAVDISYIYKENSRLNSIANEAITYIENGKDIESVRNLILSNDNNIDIKNISENEVYIEKDIKSIFGAIIGINSYHIKANKVKTIEEG